MGNGNLCFVHILHKLPNYWQISLFFMNFKSHSRFFYANNLIISVFCLLRS